jgi:hypothetical protein
MTSEDHRALDPMSTDWPFDPPPTDADPNLVAVLYQMEYLWRYLRTELGGIKTVASETRQFASETNGRVRKVEIEQAVQRAELDFFKHVVPSPAEVAKSQADLEAVKLKIENAERWAGRVWALVKSKPALAVYVASAGWFGVPHLSEVSKWLGG